MMIARIKTENGFYDSVVFALYSNVWNSTAIVFNETYDGLEKINIWIPKQQDISGLLDCAFGFHDSYVKDTYTEENKQYILFDTTWGCEILFELDGSVKTNLIKGCGNTVDEDGGYRMICDSAMFIENGTIYWVDNETVVSSADLGDEDEAESSEDLDDENWYFRANSVKWKLIIS